MIDNEFVIADHIHACEDCGHPVIVCDCHRGDESDLVDKHAYENARERWMNSMDEYNKLPFWKKLFMTRPLEPSFNDFIK